MQFKSSSKQQKLWLFRAFSVVAGLLILEIFLQTLGWFFSLKAASTSPPNVFRILTLGESTTANLPLPDYQSWPQILENLLKAHGYNVEVINEGLSATSSTIIANKLPYFLKKYQPTLVISMMGINDSPEFWMKKHGLINENSFLKKIKLLQLFYAFSSLKDDPLSKEKSLENSFYPTQRWDYPSSEKLIQQIQSSEKNIADKNIEVFLFKKTDLEKSQFYAWVSKALIKNNNYPSKAFDLASIYTEKSVQLHLNVHQQVETYLFFAWMRNEKEKCESMAQRLVRENQKISSTSLIRLASCLGRKSPELKVLTQRLSEDYEIFFDRTYPPTTDNYLHITSILHQKNIPLIAMQYPTLTLEQLQHHFQSVDFKNVHFISNEDNFLQALKHHSYKDLFTDKFGGTFGHTTNLGNSLIAEAVLPKVMELLSQNAQPENKN